MEFSKEILDQINNKKEELKGKQVELEKLLDETQKEIERNNSDIEACEHLLARCGYTTLTETVAEVKPYQTASLSDLATINE